MIQYLKLNGPINGMVCIGLGLLFFVFNVLLIEVEGTTIRLLMYTPVPLIVVGISLLIWPGAKLTRKEISDENISFWGNSPILHRVSWIVFGMIGIVFLVVQLLNLFDIANFPIESCFLSKYLGVGVC
ncbi:MAG: hypothetical protein QNK23_06130 [Crocinitomicaceae bacterium]|nr:hypothetical protein [Crocinitomicaceae bacterium]